MRCEFCGEEIEGHPFYKDGMCFCSLECADAMEGGESILLDEDILDDPDDVESESGEDRYEDEFDEDVLEDEEREY